MDNHTLELINSIANSPSAYLVLFITLLAYVLKTSSQREFKMREQLDKIVPILDNLVSKVDYIERKIDKGSDM